jgi:catechol 2,3-dioxygenase-like lactoylglutathione lyase family enzyme
MLRRMRFDHVGILVDDIDAAVAFARDVLGLGEPVEIRNDQYGLTAAFFTLGAGRLEFLRFDDPGDRLPAGEHVRIDHVAVEVDDLDTDAARLHGHGVRFTGPLSPEEVDAPVDMRGRRHLWTIPATAGGFRLQMTERADG